MKLNALALSLGAAAQLFNPAAAAAAAAAAASCPSVTIKTRNSFTVGKNVTLAFKIVKGKTTAPITDGVLTVNIPPAFRFPAATKRGGAQPSVAKGVVLTWNNVTLPAKRRHQIFKVQLQTLGCAQSTHSINATLTSALQGCTSSATKMVRAKFTKTSPSPTDCLQPGCEPKGELVVGVNNLQMTTTGIVLATDPATCVSYPPYLMYYTANTNVYLFKPPESGCYEFNTCGQIRQDLAIAVMLKCGDPTTQITCLDDSPACNLRNTSSPFAFKTSPASLSATTAYSVHIGQYCGAASGFAPPSEADCDNPFFQNTVFSADSTITITKVPC